MVFVLQSKRIGCRSTALLTLAVFPSFSDIQLTHFCINSVSCCRILGAPRDSCTSEEWNGELFVRYAILFWSALVFNFPPKLCFLFNLHHPYDYDYNYLLGCDFSLIPVMLRSSVPIHLACAFSSGWRNGMHVFISASCCLLCLVSCNQNPPTLYTLFFGASLVRKKLPLFPPKFSYCHWRIMVTGCCQRGTTCGTSCEKRIEGGLQVWSKSCSEGCCCCWSIFGSSNVSMYDVIILQSSVHCTGVPWYLVLFTYADLLGNLPHIHWCIWNLLSPAVLKLSSL